MTHYFGSGKTLFNVQDYTFHTGTEGIGFILAPAQQRSAER